MAASLVDFFFQIIQEVLPLMKPIDIMLHSDTKLLGPDFNLTIQIGNTSFLPAFITQV
jgi:hypothetical protein